MAGLEERLNVSLDELIKREHSKRQGKQQRQKKKSPQALKKRAGVASPGITKANSKAQFSKASPKLFKASPKAAGGRAQRGRRGSALPAQKNGGNVERAVLAYVCKGEIVGYPSRHEQNLIAQNGRNHGRKTRNAPGNQQQALAASRPNFKKKTGKANGRGKKKQLGNGRAPMNLD